MRLRLYAALGIAAALAAAPASAQQRGGTLVIGAAADLQSMNSLASAEANTTEVIRELLFLPLLRYRPDLQYEGALARSWQLIGDTAVVFRLRNDVFWHDGRRTSARDVVFTFQRAKDPRTAYANASNFEHWQSVQQVDSFTVRFRITPHVDPLAGWATLAIMPAHLLENIVPDQLRNAPFNRAPVGNGPFRFASYRANDRWIFEANPRFPRALGGRPYLDRIVWRVIPENPSRITELLTGQIDVMMGARADQVKEIGARPGFRGVVKPSRNYNVVMWNTRTPHLSDARVRRALLMAINRPQMIEVLRSGLADIGIGPIAPYHWAFDRTIRPLAHDAAAASRLLATAGYRDRDGDGVLESADGRKLEIELKIAANSTAQRDMAEMIRSDLARVGVTLRTAPTDFAVMVQDLRSPEKKFEAALMGFSTDFRLNMRDVFHSEAINGSLQSSSFRNARVDEILDRVQVTTNRAQATRLWSEFQQILHEEQPWAVLYYLPELLIVSDRVQGFAPDIRGLFKGVTGWSVRPR